MSVDAAFISQSNFHLAFGSVALLLEQAGRRSLPLNPAENAQVGNLRHIDCSHIKLHQPGANPPGGQALQAIGRTKGGINTKLAAVVDAMGRPVRLCPAPGQQHDLKAVLPLVPVLRDKHAVADRGFDADTFHATLRVAHVRACIRPKRGRAWRHPFHRGYYRRRHRVEDFFCRINRFRRIATRYDKLATTYLAFVQFAAVLDWLTHRV